MKISHRDKMKNKAYDREHASMTKLQSKIAELRKKGTLRIALANFSRNPKGVKRSLPPIYEGKALY